MKKCITRIMLGAVLGIGSLFFSLSVHFAVAQDAEKLPYLDTALSAEQRAADLVHRMNLAEKATQMQNNSAAVPRLNVQRS